MEPPSVYFDQTLEVTIGPHTHQRTEGTTKPITTHTTFLIKCHMTTATYTPEEEPTSEADTKTEEVNKGQGRAND